MEVCGEAMEDLTRSVHQRCLTRISNCVCCRRALNYHFIVIIIIIIVNMSWST